MIRDTTFDAAKGLAITAIVLGHVWRGIDAAGLIASEKLFMFVDTSLYTWHLCVFAFTAGLFISRSMGPDRAWQYARERTREFVWLYLVWSVLQGTIKILAGTSVNSPTSVYEILAIWSPEGQLWFFGWITLMIVGAAAARPWRSGRRKAVSLLVAVLVSGACWGFEGSFIGTQGLGLTAFFAVALVWRGDRASTVIGKLPRKALWAITLVGTAATIAVPALVAVTPPTSGGAGRTWASVALGVVIACAGLAATVAFAKTIVATKVGQAFARVGVQSMAVFVAHIVFASGTRVVLLAAGVDAVATHIVLGTAVGVAGPMLLATLAPRLHIQWLFGHPDGIRRLTSRL